MNYSKEVINYAINNKVSLEEAHRHLILNGKEFKADQKKEKDEFDIEEERKFLSDLEQDIKNQTQSAADEEWWAEWKAKMKKIEEMEKELDIESVEDKISKEEYEWVESELAEIDRLINKGDLL